MVKTGSVKEPSLTLSHYLSPCVELDMICPKASKAFVVSCVSSAL